jgi:soluble lytic murein transglycosylase-like protein
MIAVFVISIVMCACESSRDSSTETPETVKQIPERETQQPADDRGDVSPRSVPEDVSVETSEPDYIEMPRPGAISRYDKMVRKYARRYLFDWRLISAQIYTESRFRRRARSYRGALGLMQIMPGTAQWLEGKAKTETPELGGASQMLLDPEMNIHLGCYYDAMLFSRIRDAESSHDRRKMMFAAYNAGPGNLSRARRKSNAAASWEGVERHLPAETRKYIPTIYDRYEIYKQWAVLKPY